MTLRTALPGLAAGCLGVLAGLAGLVFHAPALAAVAGLAALAAGLASFVLARRLEDQLTLHGIIEHELRTERARVGDGPLFPDRAAGSPVEAPPAPAFEPPAPLAGPPTREPDAPVLDVASPGVDVAGEPVDDSALVDRATGLFSETFFRVALESRIAAARRHLRPIAVVLIEVVEGLPSAEPSPVEAALVSSTVKDTLREADTSCRLRNGYFALLLEDTPENGAIWTVERIRRSLADARDGLTVWAGVACYPAHAFTPDEILTAAERALTAAREWRQDRIEVAVAAD